MKKVFFSFAVAAVSVCMMAACGNKSQQNAEAAEAAEGEAREQAEAAQAEEPAADDPNVYQTNSFTLDLNKNSLAEELRVNGKPGESKVDLMPIHSLKYPYSALHIYLPTNPGILDRTQKDAEKLDGVTAGGKDYDVFYVNASDQTAIYVVSKDEYNGDRLTLHLQYEDDKADQAKEAVKETATKLLEAVTVK